MLSINPLDVIISCAAAYLLISLRDRYRHWKWAQSVHPPVAEPRDGSTLGHVTNAASEVICGKCGHSVLNFYTYNDGDHWCDRCHEESV